MKRKGREAMRMALIGLVLFAAAMVAGWSISSPESLRAETPAVAGQSWPAGAADGMVALSRPLENGDLQVVLVDSRRRVMSVYHVSAQTGEITLKSVRNVQWDLLMEEYNGAKPYPREIRALLERR